MENKNVGWLIIGIAFIMAIMVWLFDNVIRDNVGLTCSHGPTCEMYSSLNIQTWISFTIVGVIFIIGIFLFFIKPKEKTVIKTRLIKEKKKQINFSGLNEREKEAIRFIQEEKGAIFQATLMEKLGIGKVGLTRLLDKLEAKQIIERKRRGMNNIIILKN